MEKRYEGLRRHSRESNELTRECLRTAMLELARELDYRQITVTRLCERAGVSRMAFYRSYSVTNDVMREIAHRLNRAVTDAVGSPFRGTTSREWYVSVFRMLAERREELQLMFHESFQAEWMRLVNALAVHDEHFSAEKRFQRVMWSGGFENAVSHWLNTGMKETPEELAEYCIRYLPHLLNEEEPGR